MAGSWQREHAVDVFQHILDEITAWQFSNILV
jgi:hypothetical protein